jgi:hypothetical protein
MRIEDYYLRIIIQHLIGSWEYKFPRTQDNPSPSHCLSKKGLYS